MTHRHYRIGLLAISAALTLGACGGGGGGVSSLPPPPPPPPPASAAVKIFSNPPVAEFASVGASIAGPGGNLDTYPTETAFGTISTGAANQPHIRYTAGGFYEIEMPGQGWDRLVHYKGLANPTADNAYFQPSGVAQNAGYLVTWQASKDGYSYSELGAWGSAASGRLGYVAFGSATPAGGVPVTGSASYQGIVAGSSDVMTPDNLLGGFVPSAVSGTVALTFDFAGGTLDGSMTVALDSTKLGTFAFTDTVFSAGATAYSGTFDTTVAGQNFFLGQFTGPHAEETIGAWALPFLFGGDGKTHQAFGAWIAH